MPYPAQTDRDTIIKTAQILIEEEGIERLSLARLAAALGIKAPSLYRHIPNKAALIRAVNLLTIEQLFQAHDAVLEDTDHDPVNSALTLIEAHRKFAHTHPTLYILAFTTLEADHRPDEKLLEQMVLPLQEYMAAVVGPERSLAALRGAFALVHGFVMLELHEQLRREGDLDEAFTASVQAYLAGWKND